MHIQAAARGARPWAWASGCERALLQSALVLQSAISNQQSTICNLQCAGNVGNVGNWECAGRPGCGMRGDAGCGLVAIAGGARNTVCLYLFYYVLSICGIAGLIADDVTCTCMCRRHHAPSHLRAARAQLGAQKRDLVGANANTSFSAPCTRGPSSAPPARDVQEHLPVGLPLDPLQHRQQAPADLGEEGPQWPHQAHHRPGHPVVRARDHGHEREHELHHVPRGPQEDPRHQAPLSSL